MQGDRFPPLKGHLWVLEDSACLVSALRHHIPAQGLDVQHMNIYGLVEAIVIAGAVATKGVDQIAHSHRGMIHPTWSTVQVNGPTHYL